MKNYIYILDCLYNMGVKKSYSYGNKKRNIQSTQQCIAYLNNVKKYIDTNDINDVINSEYICKKKLVKEISPYTHNTEHFLNNLTDSDLIYIKTKLNLISLIIDKYIDDKK